MEWLDEAILEAIDALKKAELDKHILWKAGYLKGLKAAQLILRKELKNKTLKTREAGE